MSPTTPYVEQLRQPRACDHLVQLYTDEAFLGRSVREFLGSGLAAGEGAVIIATPAHAAMFRRDLAGAGLDVARAEASNQLLIRDARECLDRFMVDGMPDRERFFELVRAMLTEVQAGGHPTARLYGEMVDLLWSNSMPATVALEALWTEFLAETRLPLLCAYRMDTFDRQLQRGILHRITACHSELIPVEDYDRLEHAVTRAYLDIFGEAGDAESLREVMVERYTHHTRMPPAQAALLALQQVAPVVADAVIESARRHFGD
jgi:hypothetical protein